ncbi:MAG: MFS transporter [Steroidobacteraceae bacterium]
MTTGRDRGGRAESTPDTEHAVDGEGAEVTWPASRVAWGTVAVLAFVQGINAVDRHLINLLVGPIKADLGISDAEVGLLLGLSFAVFYTTVGVPIGRLADAWSRRLIIAIGTAFWSVATVCCGLAQNFAQLFWARVGVGAGEASLNPSGYSMIADLFPPERRARPMGVFIAGHTIGQALTLFAGGVLVQYLVRNAVTLELTTGLVLKPWQIAFLLAGLPGVFVALLVLVIREPARRETGTGAGPASIPVREVARYVAERATLYVPLIGGFAFVLVWHMGNVVWAPTFLMRTFALEPAQVGLILGLMTLVFNSSGVVLAGSLSEYFARRGHGDAHLRAAFAGALCALPFGVAATLMPNQWLALALLGPAFFFGSLPFTLAPAAIASITPNRMRAQITAVYLLCVNAFGFGLGPWLMGALTDRVFGDPQLLCYSIALTAAVALPLALLLLWRTLVPYRRAVERTTGGGRT